MRFLVLWTSKQLLFEKSTANQIKVWLATAQSKDRTYDRDLDVDNFLGTENALLGRICPLVVTKNHKIHDSLYFPFWHGSQHNPSVNAATLSQSLVTRPEPMMFPEGSAIDLAPQHAHLSRKRPNAFLKH